VRLLQLAQFRKATGHFRVLPSHRLLNAWVLELCRRLARETAPPWLLAQLDSLGYPLSAEAWLWERRFATLAERVKAGQATPRFAVFFTSPDRDPHFCDSILSHRPASGGCSPLGKVARL
jgi:hypothetical protein